MADSFLDPRDSANLQALNAKLSQLDAEMRGIAEQINAQAAAMREQQVRGRAVAREEGVTSRSQATALPALEREAAAVQEQVVSYEKLNQLIAQRIELETRAATAARQTAAATATTGAGGAVGLAASRGPSGGRGAGAVAAEAGTVGAAQRAAASEARVMALSQGEVNAGLLVGAQRMVEYDQSLQKTGALSSAAFRALADGTLTVRDLGHQIGETIGKFGGWTLAASAVFGVLGALHEVKQGAIDTSSTLQGLTKFFPHLNRGDAQQALIEQARSTATPVNDVGAAVQQFAKVTGNQTDAFTATHVALTAAKLDNISLADSYKYLTAIMQEAGAKASQLPGIFDQITAAQDRHTGARVKVLLPALAGSVGAVQSAGGDISQLTGLEALAAVRTGFEGSVLGNMFRQGAARYYGTAQARGTRSRYGINPDEGFTQGLIEAIRKSPGLSGPQRIDLASGFFGTRFGPRAAPLFRASNEQLQQFLSTTAAGAHTGLAEEQLGKTTAQANNQLTLLKVNLQAIGAELVGSHFDTPFGVMLHAINKLLEGTQHLLHAWNLLPGPIKTVGSDLAAAVAVIATLRRFNVGGMIGGGPLAALLGRNPQKILESRVGQYMDAYQGVVAKEGSAAALRLQRSQLQVAQANAELVALKEGEAASDEALQAANARLTAAEDAAAAALSDLAFLREAGSAEQLASMRQAALRGGTLEGPGGGVPPIIPFGPGGAAAAGRGGAITRALEERAATYETLGMQKFAALAGTAALVGGKFGQLANHAIPLAIAGLIAFSAAAQSIKDTRRATTQSIQGIQNATTVDQARRAYNRGVGAGSWRVPLLGFHLPNVPGEIANEISGQDLANYGLLQRAEARLRTEQAGRDASGRLLSRVNQLERGGHWSQAFQAFRGDHALQLLNPNAFNQTFNYLWLKNQSQAVGRGGHQDPFKFWEQQAQDPTNRLEPLMQSISASSNIFGADKHDLNRLTSGYAYLVARFGKNPLDTKMMQAINQAQTDLIQVTDKRVQDLLNLAEMAGTNSGQQHAYSQALGAVNQTQAKIRDAFAAARRLPGADVKSLKAAETTALGLVAQKRQTVIQGILQLAQSETDVNVSRIRGIGPAADLQRAEAQLRGLQGQLGTARKDHADARTINDLEAKVNQQLNTVLQDRVNYLQQLADAQVSYAQAGTADPIQQQQIEIDRMQKLYDQLVAAGDHDQIQLLAIRTKIRSAQMQQVQDQISQFEAQQQTNLAQANIGQPQQVQLANAVSTAQRTISYLRSLPKNKVNPVALIQAQGALYQAQGALAQFQIQQGEQMIQAETQLQQAQTFDPVEMAQIALRGAQRLLAYDRAHNMPGAQIKSDLANVAQQHKAVLEAQWQQQESTIQFLANTYQITGATEIQRLQKLYNQMKKAHASYQSLQQVAQEIFNLEYGATGGLNLNTGAIHLPSTYEVKSAIMGGRGAAKRKTTAGLLADVKTNVNLTVYVNKDTDLKKFGDTLDRALGTSVDGLAQAVGLS